MLKLNIVNNAVAGQKILSLANSPLKYHSKTLFLNFFIPFGLKLSILCKLGEYYEKYILIVICNF
jgi:hypothetical protein